MTSELDDFNLFKNAILRVHPNCLEDEWGYLKSGLTIQHFKAREVYLDAGMKNHHLGFLTKGLVRAYYINENGNEVTTMFAKENQYATDYPSLLKEMPSRYYFQCLEPTTILMLTHQHMQVGYEHYIGLERYGRLMAEEILKLLQHRVESFQFEQASQRYLNFIQDNPELFKRIPLTYLATYLGIERPSLSRIRKKIARL
jgi:CRP/FNR family transcriptional regulator